ncbi:cyclin [Cryptosporidium ryanae]|uniref:cyclin n=1 Tax=Cryptosporidium ryanae TaxID=515981 RepID=UPI003519EA9F|nr:cyclin [Cryptosporidium ryanae]
MNISKRGKKLSKEDRYKNSNNSNIGNNGKLSKINDLKKTIAGYNEIQKGNNISKLFEGMNNYNKKLVESGLNNVCRVIVLDWLIGVHRKFQFRPATIHIGIAIFDKFIVKNNNYDLINCDNLQLVGATCLHIASKYEDINPAVLLDYCIMSNSEFKPTDMINMEVEILNTLHFKVSDEKTIIDYLDSFFNEEFIKKVNKKRLPKYFYSSALYISELSLLHQTMIFINPKLLTASILILLCIIFEKEENNSENIYILKEFKYKIKNYSKINYIVDDVKLIIKYLIGIINEQFLLEKKYMTNNEKLIETNSSEELPFIYLKDLTNKWRNSYSYLYNSFINIKS